MEAKPLNFEVKVGIFVFLGILIMFIIVFSIGQLYILKPMYNVRFLFGFANGIEIGAPVRLAGVDVGDIEDIAVYYDSALQRTRVVLTAKIKNEARIEKNAVCRINTLGLLGEKYLEITPGTSTAGFVQNQEAMTGSDPVPMEEVTKTMKDLTENAKEVAATVKVIVDRIEKGQGTLGKLLSDDAMYNDMKSFVEDMKQRPWRLIGIERGEGTVGKLLSEDKIYNDLGDFVSDIKRHPWKLLIKERERREEKEKAVLPVQPGPHTNNFAR
ncbi:MAG: MlaD family protein [Candidatus Omnitrophota bacterium]